MQTVKLLRKLGQGNVCNKVKMLFYWIREGKDEHYVLQPFKIARDIL